MSLRRAIASALLVYAVASPPAWAKGGHTDDDSADDSDDAPKKAPPKKAPAKKGKAVKGKAAAKKAPPKKDDDSDDSGDDDATSARAAKGKGRGADNDNADVPDKSDDDKDDKSDKSDKDKKADAADKGSDDKGSDDSGSDDSGSDDADNSAPAKKPAAPEPVKQDLNGHDLPTTKGGNEFEHDRFFVDKTDTKKTEKGTLVQGSLTATGFAYHESGGNLSGIAVPTASPFNRLYTDLRLQTDFRHISGGRWDARIDVRGRVVNDPGNETVGLATNDPGVTDKIQSGALGENELDLRELWLTRNGEKSDITIGRQFITDLAAVKVDGVRVDYASSNKFTYLGFVGLYPVRGSRSIFTDYPKEYTDPDSTTGAVKSAGRFTGTAGFGTAYRTSNAYGALGVVALVPQDGSDARAFVTSQGYWRANSTLDIYHYAIIDGLSGAGLTELSGGINYKPTPALRLTANFNHVNTDELNNQASNYLLTPDAAFTQIQNTTYVQRISTNEARGGVSAGLGDMQRFQLTVTGAYRYRPELTLTPPGDATATDAIKLDKAQSAEIYAGFTDRRSVANLRLGIDGSQTFGVGDSTYNRTKATTVRLFGSHEIKSGRGEWEAEVDYLQTKDDNAGATCNVGDGSISTCFGDANATIIAAGGTIYYRLTRDLFVIGSAYVSRETITHQAEPALATGTSDPATIGVTGFGRIAYRF